MHHVKAHKRPLATKARTTSERAAHGTRLHKIISEAPSDVNGNGFSVVCNCRCPVRVVGTSTHLILNRLLYIAADLFQEYKEANGGPATASCPILSPVARSRPFSGGVARSKLGTGHSLQPVRPPAIRTTTFLRRLIKRDKDESYGAGLERSLHPRSHLLSSRFLRAAPSKAAK